MPIVPKITSSQIVVRRSSASTIKSISEDTSSQKVVRRGSSPINIITVQDGKTIILDVTDLGPLKQIAAASSLSIPAGSHLEFNSVTGQFITTTIVGAATTNIGGFAVTTGGPTDNAVLTFHADEQKWVFDTPFDIVDLSDGVEDGHQDFGNF